MSLLSKMSPILNREAAKGKGVTVHVMKAHVVVEIGLLLYSSSASPLDGGE